MFSMSVGGKCKLKQVLCFGNDDETFAIKLDTLRLTFTSNVKPLAKFLILQLYYNSFYTSFEIC